MKRQALTTGLRPPFCKENAFWSVGPMCGNYFHAAESGQRWDEMSLSIPDLCPCAIPSRPFGLPYGVIFTTQGPESHRILADIALQVTFNSRNDCSQCIE